MWKKHGSERAWGRDWKIEDWRNGECQRVFSLFASQIYMGLRAFLFCFLCSLSCSRGTFPLKQTNEQYIRIIKRLRERKLSFSENTPSHTHHQEQRKQTIYVEWKNKQRSIKSLLFFSCPYLLHRDLVPLQCLLCCSGQGNLYFTDFT